MQHYNQNINPSQAFYPNTGFQPMAIELPNSTGILIMGILSIIFAGLIGVILSIIALSMSRRVVANYKANPMVYTESSYSRVKAGRVCAIIGLCIFGFMLLFLILILVVGSSLFFR